MNHELQEVSHSPKRIFWIVLAFTGLALSFTLQHVDWFRLACSCSDFPHLRFIIRKFIRVLLNDLCMLVLIQAWFNDSKITRLSWYVALVDMLILLPVYLLIKLMLEGDSEISSPLLSQFHRIIINPTLMILIIPAVYFQRLKKKD